MSVVASYNPELWTCSSNDALKIAIVSSETPSSSSSSSNSGPSEGAGTAVTFHPTFTYPIFGDSEQIFGFRDLQINLAFNATTMRPLLGFKYKEKLPENGGASLPGSGNAEDPQEKLVKLLPQDSLIVNDESKWAEECEEELQQDWKVPGDLVGEYQTGIGEAFEVYRMKITGNDDDGKEAAARAKEFHRRIQIFVLFFIEAGSYIDETDDKWEYYLVFEKSKPKSTKQQQHQQHPKFVGFTTVYNYWKYPGHQAHDSNADEFQPFVRKKISQFVILPPYQSKRHGENLYKTLVKLWVPDPQVKEIVVEDPSEAFDDLRDRCDLQRLSQEGIFNLQNFPQIPVPEDQIAELQAQQKMEKRQFERCLEMGLLHLKETNTSQSKKKLDKDVRLHIKKRLYKKNREVLDELEQADKMGKLQTAYELLVEDYDRIMSKVRFTTAASKRDAAVDPASPRAEPKAKRAKV